MCLGIKYIKHYPKVIHTWPNGLQILKLQFLSAMKGEVYCIGGPLGSLSPIVEYFGGQTSHYSSHLLDTFTH